MMKKLAFAVKQCGKMGLQRIFLPFFYRRNEKKPVEPGLVLFADGHNETLPLNMAQLEQEMQKAGYRVEHWVCDFGKQGLRASMKKMVAFMKQYATAQYVVLCDYYLPVAACKKRQETTVVQLWHAGGCFKKFGYDAEDDIPPIYRGSVTENYDLVTVSAPRCVAPFTSAFGLPKEKVEPLGISRTDSFFEESFVAECRADFDRLYPQYKGKQLLLWAPTFRGNAGDPTVPGIDAILQLQEQLGDDWAVLLKLHPHAEAKLHQSNCTIPTHRLLPLVDLLITDFSSILFDYALFDKPAVLFAPDFDDYVRSRGFYLDFEEEIPYPLVTDGSLLRDAVLQLAEGCDQEAIAAFRSTFMGSCDGQATSRILQRMQVISKEKNGGRAVSDS